MGNPQGRELCPSVLPQLCPVGLPSDALARRALADGSVCRVWGSRLCSARWAAGGAERGAEALRPQLSPGALPTPPPPPRRHAEGRHPRGPRTLPRAHGTGNIHSGKGGRGGGSWGQAALWSRSSREALHPQSLEAQRQYLPLWTEGSPPWPLRLGASSACPLPSFLPLVLSAGLSSPEVGAKAPAGVSTPKGASPSAPPLPRPHPPPRAPGCGLSHRGNLLPGN